MGGTNTHLAERVGEVHELSQYTHSPKHGSWPTDTPSLHLETDHLADQAGGAPGICAQDLGPLACSILFFHSSYFHSYPAVLQLGLTQQREWRGALRDGENPISEVTPVPCWMENHHSQFHLRTPSGTQLGSVPRGGGPSIIVTKPSSRRSQSGVAGVARQDSACFMGLRTAPYGS